MKLLAELACARAPTAATPTVPEEPAKSSATHKADIVFTGEFKQQQPEPKKAKNPIKELFERKRELYGKKQLERMKLTSRSTERPRKPKKAGKRAQQSLPLIRTSQYRGGMAERKKRRDAGLLGKKKEQQAVAAAAGVSLRDKPNLVKDVYDFEEEEDSAGETGIGSSLSYRAKLEPPKKQLSMSALLSKTIGDTLTNGKSISAMGENLESMVDRKFKDLEKLAPKSKAAGKAALPSDEKQMAQNILGIFLLTSV